MHTSKTLLLTFCAWLLLMAGSANAASEAVYKTREPLISGVLATDGNLVFTG